MKTISELVASLFAHKVLEIIVMLVLLLAVYPFGRWLEEFLRRDRKKSDNAAIIFNTPTGNVPAALIYVDTEKQFPHATTGRIDVAPGQRTVTALQGEKSLKLQLPDGSTSTQFQWQFKPGQTIAITVLSE